MAAPRKYTTEQREAAYRLFLDGKQSAEIARMCANGEAGVPAFEIPRRTVHDIVTGMQRDRHPIETDAESQTLEERLDSLIERAVTGQEELGDKADPQKLAQLARAKRTLNGIGGTNGNGSCSKPASGSSTEEAAKPSLADQLRKALDEAEHRRGQGDTRNLRERVLDRDGHTCQRCGEPVKTCRQKNPDDPNPLGVDDNYEAGCVNRRTCQVARPPQ